MTNSYYTLIPKEEMTNFIRLNKKMNYFIVKELLCLVPKEPDSVNTIEEE
jgi:hypothetical protein